MKIAINNNQALLKINKSDASSLVTFFMQKASRLLPDRQWADISLVITDNKLMSSVNHEFMDRDMTTDVLSFCFPPMPGTPELYSGEIFANAEIAATLKGDDPAGATRELALYIAHGCDHLMDEDDSDTPSRRRMRNRELRWLKEADKLKLLDSFVEFSGKAPIKS